ncbi:hypothetical protein CRG98_005770 [Punica granatum]|uniref:Major facilitator superfamily (MFS) profile domain-containing protein n=1 Tax=Punica granatum TaxID=22663 RepID=A0A2I0KZZ0_PUNGR|nr:hypothetical protein CRG98_005770 [Punica granatum]
MAVGSFADAGDGHVPDFGGKITASVVITCIVAATSGLIFGYDIGISGGVTTMVPFLQKFFPDVLTSFTSSLYIAGLAASFAASRLTAAIGRRNIMVLGGSTFLAGAAINGGAENIAMLILGRILLGFGVGFTNQAAPIYLSEVAPPKWRGAFNAGFQFFIGVGVVAANCINYGTAKHSWGWRLSLGLAAIPAVIMTLGALLISDTPSSLVRRGKLSQAKQALISVRGLDSDVEGELAELVRSSEAAKAASREPFVTIFERQYRPQLVMSIAIPFFQQVTGINIIAFYAPVLFQSVGFGSNSALLAAVILGLVNLGSILVSTFVVDRHGRRFLFMEGGVQMFLCQVGLAVVLAATAGVSGTEHISKGYAALVLTLMCAYAAGFGWSWGPLSWLIPSEIFPMKIRSAGQSITVAVGFAATFVLSQTFLTMLCHFKYGIFLFYAGWIGTMTIFVVLLLPETKGIPLDSMYAVWEQHWFWCRFVKG